MMSERLQVLADTKRTIDLPHGDLRAVAVIVRRRDDLGREVDWLMRLDPDGRWYASRGVAMGEEHSLVRRL